MWRDSTIQFLKNGRPLVIAHRGDSANVPENTLQAFIDADQLHVDIIETDIRLTKDEQFVFNHDAKVDRTTNGKGLVSDYNLSEIKQLDAGFRFKNDNKENIHRGKGLQIQSMEEILLRFPNNRFNMDIKDKDPKAPILLAEKLRQFNAESRIQVSSFHQNQIIEFRKHSKSPTSASIGESWQFHKKATKWIKHNENRLRELKADDELGQQQILEQQKIFGYKLPYCSLTIFEGWGPLRLVTPDIIKFAHLVGIAVLVWTINSPIVMKKLLDWNVDGIFTDAPGILLTIVKEYT